MKHFILLCAIFSIGCSPSVKLSGLVPVAGTVTLDGEPLADATLSFVPQNWSDSTKMRTGVAMTDANGRFKAMTLQLGDGLYPGEFNVLISKTKTEPYTAEQQQRLEAGKFVPKQQSKEVVPKQYTDAASTPFKITIGKSGDKNLNLELHSK
jgi:hypothetical protein